MSDPSDADDALQRASRGEYEVMGIGGGLHRPSFPAVTATYSWEERDGRHYLGGICIIQLDTGAWIVSGEADTEFPTLQEAKQSIEDRIVRPSVGGLVLDGEIASEMQAALEQFYGQRVTTVSSYCGALYTWLNVVQDSGYLGERLGLGRDETRDNIINATLTHLRLSLEKSNLAFRLLYLGEKVRTKKCPVHDGHWTFGFPDGINDGKGTCEHCMSAGNGWNIPGWIYEG
jgi:hypothetical protein